MYVGTGNDVGALDGLFVLFVHEGILAKKAKETGG
jgi:hypothetical protein